MFVLCSVDSVVEWSYVITIMILLAEYVCFVFCRLGGRVVLGNHYHHIVNRSMFVLYSVDSVVEWS